MNKRKQRQPKRGFPGVLLTCETGRESKCKREGLDILRHYFYLYGNTTVNNDDDDAANVKNKVPLKVDDVDEESKSKEKSLSLEDEIALLKKGVSSDQVLAASNNSKGGHNSSLSKLPFFEYDTGCRGTIFLLCTLPNSSLISSTTEKHREHGQEIIPNKNNSSTNKRHLDEKEESNVVRQDEKKPRICKEEKTKVEQIDHIHRIDKNISTKHAEHNDVKLAINDNRQESEEKSTATAKSKTIEANKSSDEVNHSLLPWDPIETIKHIISDLDNSNSMSTGHKQAPSSRFVTRMIPIQATCFASIDEIRSTSRALIRKFLFPKLQVNEKGKNTFAVAIKRRNCSNVTRNQIIDTVVDEVFALGDCGESADSNSSKESPWKVDLKNPEHTICIEICKTLCGISIIERIDSYRNFNLIEIRESSSTL